MRAPRNYSFVIMVALLAAFCAVQTIRVIRLEVRKRAEFRRVEQLEQAVRQPAVPNALLMIESLLRGLVRLSETDADARTVVVKYRLSDPAPDGAPR